MKKILFAAAAVLASAPALAQEAATATCFNKAATEVEYAACLKDELAELTKKYDNVVEQVMSQMRAADRVQKNKKSTQAFTDANKAFQGYVKDECDLVELVSGAGNGAGMSAAGLSCRINLTRLRLGALQHQFLRAP